MANPYSSQPAHAFWRRSVAGRGPADVDPVVDVPFRLSAGDAVATAGSCFAQHISRTLQRLNFHYLITETSPDTPGAADENYGVFPARFGNIYTVRQLLQLFQRAYGVFEPADTAWRGKRGAFIDPFRPRVQEAGFVSVEALRRDRAAHLAAVRRMFEHCNVFVFTFGLTEGWEAIGDGAVFPLPPGVVAEEIDGANYRFHNFSVAEMEADMRLFLTLLRRVNPSVRIVLTVSPVALAATYEKRHVLVANSYSKSALRVVAESMSASVPGVVYFPSYEIITGAPARGAFLSEDLREVTTEGVDHVMAIFARHFLASGPGAGADGAAAPPSFEPARRANDQAPDYESPMMARQAVVCDEDVIEQTA